MAPKSMKVEAEENPFLLPPIDLNRIHLAEKDHLIVAPGANSTSWICIHSSKRPS
jgi:hypothetical protein